MSVIYNSISGKEYEFHEYDIYDQWYWDRGGIYIFAERTISLAGCSYYVYYVGENNCFGRRMSEQLQDKWPKAVHLNANCVLACVINYEQERTSLEKEIIRRYAPSLNVKHNPLVGLGYRL